MKTIEAIDVLVNEMINTESAPNYKGWIVADETTGNEYVITVQDKDGESPSEQLAAAKAEIAEVTKLLDMVCGSYDSGEIADYFYVDQDSALKIIDVLAKHKGE